MCLSLTAWSNLLVKLSISVVMLFEVLLFHFTLRALWWSVFCQSHWELFYGLMDLRITKCYMVIESKFFLYLASPVLLPIFHLRSLLTFHFFSNLHPYSHSQEALFFWRLCWCLWSMLPPWPEFSLQLIDCSIQRCIGLTTCSNNWFEKYVLKWYSVTVFMPTIYYLLICCWWYKAVK